MEAQVSTASAFPALGLQTQSVQICPWVLVVELLGLRPEHFSDKNKPLVTCVDGECLITVVVRPLDFLESQHLP